jgi:hypothetical protein
MNSKPMFDPTALIRPTAAETRAAALRMEEERREARRAALAEQVSIHHSARERIDIWERLHGLRLPTRAAHPLLIVIAEQTGLMLSDVVDEQRRRVQPKSPPAQVAPNT